ncbi:Alpha/beta hydrolase family-domain-containing protein [Podospora didyma]|uniref:Alpha/beta hydrolase family-domain-containing protein n=1 Tax=Podospora didyma TaxID=330526 RepID=A0AAE0P863_9PEZI|nr:Alpha/beta hydrolase family-domain-containing protein [Podospora didyma]
MPNEPITEPGLSRPTREFDPNLHDTHHQLHTTTPLSSSIKTYKASFLCKFCPPLPLSRFCHPLFHCKKCLIMSTTANSPKPTIVIVPGAWHTPDNYSRLTSALFQAGYPDIHCVSLPSVSNERPPMASLAEDTAAVRSTVESLINTPTPQNKTIVVIMHSYGGMVGTNALSGLGVSHRNPNNEKGGVAHLLYMCAYVFDKGASLMSKGYERGHDAVLEPELFDFGDDGTLVMKDPRPKMIGEITDYEIEKEVPGYLAAMKRTNGAPMGVPLDNAAWREIPASYVYATKDGMVSLGYQKDMVRWMEEAGTKVQIFEIETGHCPNLTATKEMVEVVDKVVQGLGR